LLGIRGERREDRQDREDPMDGEVHMARTRKHSASRHLPVGSTAGVWCRSGFGRRNLQLNMLAS
jgi:hypothetical protein